MKTTLTLLTALLLAAGLVGSVTAQTPKMKTTGVAPLTALHAAEAAKPTRLEKSPITNRWGEVTPVRIKVDHVTVFRGREGEAYSHKHQLTSHLGKLYATWSLGIRDEEGPGEKMVMAVSDDHGKTWTAPITIAPSRSGEFAPSIVQSSGLHIFGNTFVAYSGEWEWQRDGINTDGTRKPHPPTLLRTLRARTEARVSHDAGRTWSDPVLIAPRLMGYFPPFPTHSGRLILPGALTYCYTDDPSGLTGWRRSGIPGLPDNYVDDFYSCQDGAKLLGIKEQLTEANFFQTNDGVIHMMHRDQAGKALLVTESRDDGLTWSAPKLTSFTDNVCRAHFGRLPDGRFFAMSCPVPGGTTFEGKRAGYRTPMVLAISRDGVIFDRHFILGDEPEIPPRMQGLYKLGRYGYPYLHVMGDEVFVLYSINKEEIAVGRFHLADITP